MESKKIVNIINFIRAEDPRVEQNVLYNTFKNQIELCKNYSMPYTFLMQYDAFIRPEYAKLLLNNKDKNMEIGVWIELAREQIEKVGLKWGGKPEWRWDWRVYPDMLMGYTVSERKLLIDELMDKFFNTFGYYPKSVGSWLLDTYSIQYMTEKYKVEAFCICKEQFGTDGYTLWGGYYNQGYYPSKNNMFVPAQTENEQINTPIFRMLGPDPIYQYDFGLDKNFNFSNCQRVMTLEPSWECGQDPNWVDWYLQSNYEQEGLNFSYTQVGQENPFTWDRFSEALKMQMEKVYAGVKLKKWQVMTLSDTGKWFSNTFKTTPSTAITALNDWKNEGNKTVWYNSKRYRLNLLSNKNCLFIRDLFLFDEKYKERYLNDCVKGSSAIYDTLPIIDGYRWSGNGIRCGWFFENTQSNLKCDATIISSNRIKDDVLKVTLKINNKPSYFYLYQDSFKIELPDDIKITFKYNSLEDTEIIFLTQDSVCFKHNNFSYGFKTDGLIKSIANGFMLLPKLKTIQIFL